MITAQQKIEIIEFLLSKKMSVDVIMEIHDHFCTHISEQMEKEDISFDEAFLNTQLSWKSDLKMMKLSNGNRVTHLYRNIALQKEGKIILYAIYLVLVMLMVMVLVARLISKDQFSIFFITCWMVLFLAPIIYYLFHFNDFRLIRKYKNKVLLNSYQAGIVLIIPAFIVVAQSIFNFKYHKRFYEFLHGNTEVGFSVLVIVFCSLLLYFIGLISMFSFIKRLQKTKSFLHYFNY